MARYSKAQWRPIPLNYSVGGNSPRLLVVHIMEGTLAGTDSWFRNSAAQASAHFGVGKDGTIYQWVDTKDRAWHAVNANDHSIGVEHEGNSGDTLTAAQLDATAGIYAWAHKEYGALSMWLNTNPTTGSGLSWHGLGGNAWGGHFNCPGTPIVGQLPHILSRADTILNPPPPPTPPSPNDEEDEEDMMLNNGQKGLTVISLTKGSKQWISFGCDNTLQKLPDVVLRVAVHSASKGWATVRYVTVHSGEKPGVTFDQDDVDIVSVRRENTDGGENASVSYNMG